MTRVEDGARDIAFGARTLLRSPLYALVASVTIAVAIAANIAVVSVLVHVLLQPLPYPNADRLVFVASGAPGLANQPFGYLDAVDVAKQSTNSLEAFGISLPNVTATFTGGAPQPVVLQGNDVSPGYFATLGVRPAMGRGFSASDLGTRNVIISDRMWRKYFRATTSILGRTLELDGAPHTIIGVMYPGFRDVTPSGPAQRDYWTPMDPDAAVNRIRGTVTYDGWGLVRRNVSVAAAQADVARIMRDLVKRYPADHPDWGRPLLRAAADVMVAPVKAMIWLLYVAVTLLLMIACANVMILNLARTAARSDELTVREALGATRTRIASQLGWEMGLVCLAGGVVGISLGWLVLHILASVAARLIPRWDGVGINATVFAYTAFTLVAIAIVTAVVPALFSSRDLSMSLKAAGRSGESGLPKKIRTGMASGEIALVLGLVLAAALVVRSFVALTNVPIGFDGSEVWIADAPVFLSARYRAHFAEVHAMERVAAKLRAIPGVTSVAMSSSPPFETEENTFTTFGQRRLSEPVDINVVSPGYFGTMRIRLLRGRDFDVRDQLLTRQVAIVNATFARQFFGTLNVLGRTYDPYIGWEDRQIRTIVGVADDTRSDFRASYVPLQYLLTAQVPGFFGFFVVRTDKENAGLAPAVARAYASVDPQFAEPRIRSYGRIFEEHTAGAHLAAVLFGGFAIIALALGVAGVYAVTRYTVEQRRHEFGIRKALGADGRDLLTDVLTGALYASALGVSFGVVIMAFATRLLVGVLFQTSPFDPVAVTLAVLLVTASSLLAALLPAMHASRIEAAVALRYE